MNEIYSKLITLVISLLGVYLTYLINKLVKNKELKDILLSFHDLIRNSVLNIQQTYVDALKKCGNFSPEAQKEALERCLELVKANMPNDIKSWLQANYSDIDAYLKSQIEAQIAELKK